MTRKVVITADDLGVDEASIHAVAALVPAGRVSAASIIPMAAWAGLAVDRLKEFTAPGRPEVFSLGVHATLTNETSRGWGPRTRGMSLVPPGGSAFHPDVTSFAEAATHAEVLAELRAQIAWFAQSGVRPTHLDSHAGAIYGIHGRHFLHSAVLACAEHGLALRLPRTVPGSLGALLRPAVRIAHRAAVALAEDLEVQIPEVLVTDWRPGAEISGYEDLRNSYLRMIGELPEGLSEIFLHPAAATGDRDRQPAERMKRQWELQLLQDDVFADALTAEGVAVVTWGPNRVTVDAEA